MRFHRHAPASRRARWRPRWRSAPDSPLRGDPLTALAYHIDAYLQAQDTLNHLRDEHRKWDSDERAEYTQAIEAVMKFNALLRRVIIAKDDTMTFSELEAYLRQHYEALHGEYALDRVESMFRAALVGIRHEVSFARVLDHTALPYRHGSDNEDSHGGDYMLYGYIPIDIKASELNAEREQRAAVQHHHDPSHIFYTGIVEEDYQGRLLLPDAAAARIAQQVLPILQDIVARYHHQDRYNKAR